ncbi:hypothetical protein TIFTF001_013900 [Ficus carica]|uniref:Uncharacterized protein n=1 Tax=Ficus carica TaxID=3494 RepID=A0AA88D3H1_FICCA|nr:hypothetical protein TIFTF001_013900 [Ficus carica]
MCSQNKFLQEHIKQTKNLDKVCTNKELYTKCPINPTPKYNEVESIFFADKEINDQTLCALQLSDSDAETSSSALDSEPYQGEYSFDISHIKGKDNVIPDFLSRPAINLITAKHNNIPLIFTITKPPESMTSSSTSNLMTLFPPTFLKDATSITLSDDLKKKAINHALKIQTKLIQTYGESMVQDFIFHPKYLFARIFPIREAWFMPRPLNYFFWYLTSFYTIAIEVHTVPLRTSIRSFQYRPDLRDAYKTQIDLLSWFASLSIWDQYLSFEWEIFTKRQHQQLQIPVAALTKCYTIFLINLNCKTTGKDQVAFAPSIEIHGSHEWPLSPMGNVQIRQLEKLLIIKNHTIPDEVWPKPEEDAPWERFPVRYTQQIKKVLDEANAGPSSTPKMTEPEEAQSIHFQSEGPSLEEEFQFIQWAQDPYSSEPFNPKDFTKLGVSPPPSQSTQSCSFKYQIAQETHVAPQPVTLRVSEIEAAPTPPWLTDQIWENEENVQQVLQIIDDAEQTETTNKSPSHEPINKSSW